MKRLVCLLSLSCSLAAASAQQPANNYKYQDLTDPSYIYYQKENEGKLSISEIPSSSGTAVLFNNMLYKHVDLYEFFVDSNLVSYRGKQLFTERQISRYTDDPRVTQLYVVGRAYSSDRKNRKMATRSRMGYANSYFRRRR